MLLVQLVKLRLIVEKTADLPWFGVPAELDASMRAPAIFYLKSLKAQFQEFKANIPNELIDNSKRHCLSTAIH